MDSRARTGLLALALAALSAGSACRSYDVAPPAIAEPATPSPAPGHVRVAGVVLKWIRGEKAANWERAEPLIRHAARAGATLIVTTESFLDGYAVEDPTLSREAFLELAETIPGGAYYERIAALADELDVYLLAGLLERDGQRTFNTAAMIGPDGALLGRYHKQVLMGPDEERNEPGRESTVIETPIGTFGTPICSDRTERSVVRGFRDAGAEVLLIPSGGGFGPRYNDGMVARRARETGLPIVFVHPAEFLVATPDGLLHRALLGDGRNVTLETRGGEADSSGVFFVDLPLGPLGPLGRPAL